MPPKFISKDLQSKPSFNIGITLGRKPTKGEVGLEIEVEGKNIPKDGAIPPPWVYHIDHSLRGAENAEYVLAKPIAFDDVPKALDKLWKTFDEWKSVFDDSNRTSVHVHLNCQEFYLNRLTAFFALWYALEEPLTEFCGEHRVGNLFCLRAVDAPALVTYMKRFVKNDGAGGLPEILHYGGLNPNALYKYGSLEIRTLRFDGKQETIQTFLNILQRLYLYSAEFSDPREVVALFSSGGPLSYFDTLLGDQAPIVKAAIGWSNQEIADAMYRGIRFAQEICYCRDWDLYKTQELKPDPFGRDSRKLVNKITNYSENAPVADSGLMQETVSFATEYSMPDIEDDMPEEPYWGDEL